MEETLFDNVVEVTGWPKETVRKMFNEWVLKSGRSPQGLSLEDLREVMVGFLQEVFLKVKAGENPQIKFVD